MSNKIIKYWNKSSIWKQALITAVSIFTIVFILSIAYMITSESEMKGLSIFIPLFPLVILFESYRTLKISLGLSIIINLSSYYVLGLLIAFIINKVKK